MLKGNLVVSSALEASIKMSSAPQTARVVTQGPPLISPAPPTRAIAETVLQDGTRTLMGSSRARVAQPAGTTLGPAVGPRMRVCTVRPASTLKTVRSSSARLVKTANMQTARAPTIVSDATLGPPGRVILTLPLALIARLASTRITRASQNARAAQRASTRTSKEKAAAKNARLENTAPRKTQVPSGSAVSVLRASTRMRKAQQNASSALQAPTPALAERPSAPVARMANIKTWSVKVNAKTAAKASTATATPLNDHTAAKAAPCAPQESTRTRRAPPSVKTAKRVLTALLDHQSVLHATPASTQMRKIHLAARTVRLASTRTRRGQKDAPSAKRASTVTRVQQSALIAQQASTRMKRARPIARPVQRASTRQQTPMIGHRAATAPPATMLMRLDPRNALHVSKANTALLTSS